MGMGGGTRGERESRSMVVVTAVIFAVRVAGDCCIARCMCVEIPTGLAVVVFGSVSVR